MAVNMDKIISKDILAYAWKNKIKPSIEAAVEPLSTEIEEISTNLEKKLDAPETEGTVGQVLTKTADGAEWSNQKNEVFIGSELPEGEDDIEIFIDETETPEVEIYTKEDVDAHLDTLRQSDADIKGLLEKKVVVGNETTNSEGFILIDTTANASEIDIYTKDEIDAQYGTLSAKDNALNNLLEKKVVVGNESTNSEGFILIDTTASADEVEIYTKEEIDAQYGTLSSKDTELNNLIEKKVVFGNETTNSECFILIDETVDDNSQMVYTKMEVDALIAKLKADNNLI